MDELRNQAMPVSSTTGLALVSKKLIGVVTATGIGLIIGVVVGRGFKCPPWRHGVIFGQDVDTERVAVWCLFGMLVGGTFVGGHVGRLGWMMIGGMFTGLLIGNEFLPFLPVVGLTGRYQGAIAGAVLGLSVGVIWEISRSKSARIPIASWSIIVFMLIIFMVPGLIFVKHLQLERRTAEKIADLGGDVQREFGCVRYVSCNHINDAKLALLVNELHQAAYLKSLSLSDCPITDEGLKSISGLDNLRWLYLGNTRITDAGVHHLTKLVNLEYLDLRETAVSEAREGDLRAFCPHLQDIRR